MSITASENLAVGNIPSKTTPDIDIDYATRYVQISTASISATHDLNGYTNTRLTDHLVSYVGIGVIDATDNNHCNPRVVAFTHNKTSFYNASCMGQYYTVNFS